MQPDAAAFKYSLSHFVLQAVSERLELAPAGGRSEPQVSTMRDFDLALFLFRRKHRKIICFAQIPPSRLLVTFCSIKISSYLIKLLNIDCF